MINWRHIILIPIILLVAASIPQALGQTNLQLSLTLVGQDVGRYITPAGQTTAVKLEILNLARLDVYLLQGEAYLDPDLSGTWQLIHSEQLGNFHLGFLQSAIWTFDLTVPAEIQAANVTNGTPNVNLLIKIIYSTVLAPQNVNQRVFALNVPGASVQQQYGVVPYAIATVLALACIGIVWLVGRRRH